MKKHFTLLTLLLLGYLAPAQEFEAPARGAKIYAKEYQINLESGSNATFDLWIVRSRMARRAKFMDPKLVSSSGLSFKVLKDANDQDHYTVTVSADNLEEGHYTSTVSARSTGTQKVVGTTLTFNVVASRTVASKDGE